MSWGMVEIGSLVDKVTTWNPIKEKCDTPFLYIDLSSVDKDKKKVDSSEVSQIFSKDAPSRARQLVRTDDVLVATVRPNLNGVALVQSKLDGATASTGYCVLRANTELLDSTYLFYWVQTVAFISDMMSKATGANYPAVSDKIIKESKIPLPYPEDPEKSLKEQKRIAAILDKADGIRRKRKQAIQLADDFLRSVFLDMFGDPVTNPKGWEVGTIRDLIVEAKYGTSGKADPKNGKYAILRMGNLTYRGTMDYSDLKYIDVSEKEKEKYIVRKGDLLFNRTNSRELVGKAAVFDSDEEMIIAGYLIRVRANDEANTHYISGYLNSKHGKSTLLHMCKSIVGMANINAQELQDIKIMRPPVTLQNKYRDICDEVNLKLNAFNKSEVQISYLFQALSQQSFSKGI